MAKRVASPLGKPLRWTEEVPGWRFQAKDYDMLINLRNTGGWGRPEFELWREGGIYGVYASAQAAKDAAQLLVFLHG